jgi:hypothetical protein
MGERSSSTSEAAKPSAGMSEQSSSPIYDFATTDDTDKTDVTDFNYPLGPMGRLRSLSEQEIQVH